MLDEWIDVIAKLCEKSRKDRKKRISKWAALAGPPHAEVLLGDDPKHMDKIGFWRVPGGLIRVRASFNGKFDPAERIEITDQEIEAIISAFKHPVIKEEQIHMICSQPSPKHKLFIAIE